MTIKNNIQSIYKKCPQSITLCAAAKTRTVLEVEEAITSGVNIIGMNYLQEALKLKLEVSQKATWSLIGHLQKNKVRQAVKYLDRIESVDSIVLAQKINDCSEEINKFMEVFIEINIASEKNKNGVEPKNAYELCKEIEKMPYLGLKGVMTMGPNLENKEDIRSYFKECKVMYDIIREECSISKIEYLSMGMSDTYEIAIEEGANYIRLGTAIFGKRRD